MARVITKCIVRLAREIMKCACETVTDERIQMIVRDAETDAPQCLNLATSTRRKLLDVIMDPSTCSMATSTGRKILHLLPARILECACETVMNERIQIIVRDAEADAPQCLNLATS